MTNFARQLERYGQLSTRELFNLLDRHDAHAERALSEARLAYQRAEAEADDTMQGHLECVIKELIEIQGKIRKAGVIQ